MTAATDTRAAAIATYTESVRNGEPLSGSALGAKFKRSDSWGRAVIRGIPTAEPDPEPISVPEVSTEPAPALGAARFYAWVGFLLGTVASTCGNVLSSWLPVVMGTGSVHPSIYQQVLAALWPLALLVSVEILSRTAWRHGFAWRLVRVSGVIAVALGSGVISYTHLLEVLVAFDYGPGAYLGPLVLDGLLLVSGFALISMSSARKEVQS